MSNYRPLNHKCSNCNIGVVEARCWVRGEFKKIDGKRKLVHLGYWEMKCGSCNHEYQHTL